MDFLPFLQGVCPGIISGVLRVVKMASLADQAEGNADRDKFNKSEGGVEEVSSDEKTKVFEDWLLENGARFPRLTMRQYDDEVRGVHAAEEIDGNEVIVEVPLQCLITVEMGKATEIGQTVAYADIDFDAPKHVYLMLFMLIDRKKENSFFKPYYDILPATLSNMPIFWNESELALLKGSYLLTQIDERNAAIESDYNAICEVCPEFADIATLEDFKWARMCVCSRNFGITVDGIRTSAMVPYADMLNHYRPRETKWSFDQARRAFTITTLQPILCGAQVYDSYGQKCNHRFLLNYGFSIENNREVDGFCPNEVPFIFRLDSADPLHEYKLRLWMADGYQSKLVRVCVSDNDNTSTAFSCLRVIVATQEEFTTLSQSYMRSHSPRGVRDIKYSISLSNERRALQKFDQIIDGMLAEYPTTFEEDKQRLAGDDLQPFSNERHAVIQVMGEKEVLLHYKEHCRIGLEMLSLDSEDDHEAFAKWKELQQSGVDHWILKYCALEGGAVGTCRRLERRARLEAERRATSDPTKPHIV